MSTRPADSTSEISGMVQEVNDRKKRILVVDDEPSVRQVVGRILAHRGYESTLAHSVDHAIQHLSEQTYSLIISDHKMPMKTGEDLYHFVADSHPELIEKFILITGFALDPAARRFIEETNVRVLEKPFDLSKLIELVELLLKK